MDDRQFMINFGAVIGALTVIGVIVFIIAQLIPGGEPDKNDPIIEKMLEQRIKPVGDVYVGSVPPEAVAQAQPAQAQPAGAEAAAPADGKKVYNSVCMACHTTGAANAPKLGDKAAWAKYLGKSMNEVYSGAIKGRGGMPAKGGRADLTDEQVKAAVDYLVESVQ